MRPGTLLRWHSLKNILKHEVKDGSTILDIGGYDGYISYRLKKIFSDLEITVIDTDELGLRLAKDRGLRVICASVLELPIKDKKFNVVLCFDLIEHVKEDVKLVKELSRVLKDNGKIILTTPMKDGVSFPMLNKKKNEIINKNWGHVRKGYSLEQIRELFKLNHLIIDKEDKYFNYFSRLAYRFGILSRIPLRGMALLYQAIIRLEPYIKYGSEEYIIVGRKIRP
jgi:ubiquinone/menaquinone biosynthesis C-methylase UbiE